MVAKYISPHIDIIIIFEFAAMKTKGPSVFQRILGGEDAYLTPFFAMIHTSTKICGGALITENLVLSSASCTDEFVYSSI